MQRTQEALGMKTNADELSMAEKAQVSAEHSYLAKGCGNEPWFPCCYRAGRELKTNSSQLLGEASKTEMLSDLLNGYNYSEVVPGLGSGVFALWHRRLNQGKWPVW